MFMALIHLPQNHSSDCISPCSSILKEVLPFEDQMCMCLYAYCFIFQKQFLSVLSKTVFILRQFVCARSWVNAKGQQFVRMQIIEGSQVWQAQEELGEECSVIWAAASDQ